MILKRLGATGNVNPWLLLIPLTACSFLFSGYIPIFGNNIYQTPILLRSYDLPQFADDAFTQSLRYFSSGFWVLFAGAGRYFDIKLFLGIWLVINHFALLAASLYFAKSLGMQDRRQLNIFLVLICCSPLLYGATAGGGAMMINYFTHSELANASLLTGFSFAIRRRYGFAAVSVCVTFFLNAFMAVWMLPAFLFLSSYHLLRRQISPRRFLIDAATGSLIGSVFLVVPILNILQNPDVGQAGAFSYQDFLWHFFPYHFFFSSLTYKEMSLIAISLAAFLLTTRLDQRYGGEMLMLGLGCVALLMIAAIAPVMTDSRMILNLHLVRGFVVLAMLAAIGLALVASRWVTAPWDSRLVPFGLVLAGALVVHKYAIVLAVAVLLAEYAARYINPIDRLLKQKSTRIAIGIFLVISAASLPIRSIAAIHESVKEIRRENAWERAGAWANQSTPPDSVFQVSEKGAVAFSSTSQRKLWFDFKYGAAVMWSPSYYQIWKTRHLLKPGPPDLERPAGDGEGRVDYEALECNPTITQPPQYSDGGVCIYKRS